MSTFLEKKLDMIKFLRKEAGLKEPIINLYDEMESILHFNYKIYA
jgi:hypothetical protein